MFYEFRELTPIGRRGDEMIRKLCGPAGRRGSARSGRRASAISGRPPSGGRGALAGRGASGHGLSDEPQARPRHRRACAATRIADLAGELRQQRLLLEARAQSDIGRRELALDIISNISGREAIRLRSDIYWSARRWREAAEQIELLLWRPLAGFLSR